MSAVTPRADALFDAGDYAASLQTLAALRTPVDAFFDGVMVNADDPTLKRNRLRAPTRAACSDEPRGRSVEAGGSGMKTNALKLVIMDRDGTINEDRDDFVKSAEEWIALPGALEAIARLNHAGWHVVIASNQSGLGRGLFDVAALNAMHSKMFEQLAVLGGRIDAVFYCPHTPDENCACRKPQPGLYKQIAERYGVDLVNVPVVADSARDLQAAIAVGAQPHLVRTGKAAAFVPGAPLPPTFPAETLVHADLAEFVAFLNAQQEAAAKSLVAT